jgi:hypothetical protein
MNPNSNLIRLFLVAVAAAFAAGGAPAQDLADDIDTLSRAPGAAVRPHRADHSRSARIDDRADEAGRDFIKGVAQIVEPFVVVGRTVKDGATFVILKGAAGVTYVAESAVVGLEYVVEGARFVAIATIEGVRWVSVEAIKAGKAAIKVVVKTARIVIDGVEYVLVQLNDTFVYVARTAYDAALKAGKLVVNGVTYAMHQTVAGAIWVAEQAAAITAGAWNWTRSRVVSYRIRRKIATSLSTFGAGEGNLRYFRDRAADTTLDESTRNLARAALKASEAYNEERGHLAK